MDLQYERQLEAEIDRELKALPELRAPATLAPRVLARLEARATVPRYRQLWQSWSWSLRGACLAGLLVLFGGLCFASSALLRLSGVAALVRQFDSGVSVLAALYRGLMALLALVTTTLKHVDSRLLLAGLAALLLAYALCLALTACSIRLGLTRTRE